MADKYARDEFERRFLVSGEVPQAEVIEDITDRYIIGTRLRLRRNSTNERTIHKLGKIEDVAPGHKKLTNLYLTDEEAAALHVLPAKVLTKRRHVVSHAGRTWVVDEFFNGMKIAEIEHAEGEEVEIPDWCGEEITDKSDYSGWAMAH
jgi:CYTH domain-containing protein